MRGLKLEFGSVEESLALRAHRREQSIKWTQTQVVVSAIMLASNRIAAALSKDGQDPDPSSLKELLTDLQETLFPEFGVDREDRNQKAKKRMEKELASGPFKVEAMSYRKK